MRMELKSLLRSCAFSAAVLFTGASASANEYILTVEDGTVVPVEDGKEHFSILCVDIDKRCTDMLLVGRDLSQKQVSLGTPSSGKVMVNLDTPENHTSFSFNIGSFKFCYTFSSKGGVMKIKGGNERDSLQIQNNVDNQTFEIDAIKANMLSITRGSYNTEVISMSNCNANTVLLTEHGVHEELLLQTSGKNYIHNLILNCARIQNDGMMKVDGIFCDINGSIMGSFPDISPEPSHSQNAFFLRDKDLVINDSFLGDVDSTSKNCTFFSDTSDSRVKHKDSFYELPDKGYYRFILLGDFKCSGKEDVYCLLRKEDFHFPVYSAEVSYLGMAAHSSEGFGTYLRCFEAPVDKDKRYSRNAFVSLFKNVESVDLQIGKVLSHGYYQPCELKCASIGHALVIIREKNDLHQEPHQESHQEPHQEESSPFFNRLIYQL